MKRKLLSLVLSLCFSFLSAQAPPPPIVTGLTDPSSVLVIGDELYITETGNNTRIVKVNLNDPTPATPTVVLSGLNTPKGLTHDGDYLYFVQYGSGILSRIDLTQTNPVKEDLVLLGLTNPSDIAINGNDLYVAVTGGNQIAKVDLTAPTFPTFPTVIQGVPAPGGLAIYNNLLVISTTNTANILAIDMTLGINPPIIPISTAGLNTPKGLTIDGNTLFIADDGYNRISKIDLSQTYPVEPTLVTTVQHPQDVIHNGFDLIISELGTDEVIRVPNPCAIETYLTNNPGGTVYTGHADSTEAPGYDNPLSWTPNGVPTTGWNLVVLPVYGYEIKRNLDLNSLTVLDGAWLDIHKNVKIASLSQFGVNSIINWVAGTLSGNALLNNRGQVNCTTSNMTLSDGFVFANYGGFRFETAGDLYMNQSTFHNTAIGEIKFDFPGTDIYNSLGAPQSALVINEGIIRKTSSGTSVIGVDIQNINGGIIQTEIGDIEIRGDHTINGGIINTYSGTTLTHNYLSDVTLTGLLTGSLYGTLNFASGDIIIPGTATIDFIVDNPIELYGTDISGGGTLNLKDDFTIEEAGFDAVVLYEGTTINNEGMFTLASPSNNFQLRESTFNNLSSGIIDIQSAGIANFSSTTEQLNNYGLIKKTTSTGTSSITAALNNFGGTIQVERGRLDVYNSRQTNYLEGGFYHVDSVENVLDFNYHVTCLGDLKGTLNGNIMFSNYGAIVDSATTATFDFDGPGIIEMWGAGFSGKGTFINKSHIKNMGLFIGIVDSLTFNNEGYIAGNINMSGGDLYNKATGTLDVEGTYISSYNNNHTLYNTGLIKKSGPSTSAVISVPLHNLDGRIQVERGRLIIQDDESRFVDGQYDVDSVGNELYLDHTITCQGELKGTLDGPILWSEHILVDSATTAILDFDGPGGIDWTGGSLRGGGLLVNKSSINLKGNTQLIDGSTLNNQGLFNSPNGWDLQFIEGVFNNMQTGVVDLQATSSNFTSISNLPQVLNNMGLIKKSGSTGIAIISTPLHNTGAIQVDSGTVRFTDTLYNYQNSTISGTGTIDLPDPALYIHEGIYSPGASPGKLDVIGDFESTGTSVLDIELNGLTQESEYDLVAVQGAANVNGSIDLSLGFEPVIGNSFTIMTSSGALAANLPSSVQATAPSNDVYTFDVQINTNSIVLQVLSDCLMNRGISNQMVTGNYNAGLNITVSNVSVTSATIFSAPNVSLNSEFTVPDGQQLEVIQVGCN